MVTSLFGSGNSAPATSSVLISFIAAGTGAVTRTMQSKSRDIVSVLDYGAACDLTTDDTAAFARAFAASNRVYAPAIGAGYLVSNITLTDRDELFTDGLATIFQQMSGQAVGTHIIDVQGSNITIGSCTLKGNISTDTNEQQHGVFVRKAGSTIQNITIGDLYGENIRGDVLYMGAETGYATQWIRFGRIVGKNVLRNVVSIVGATYITGDAVITDTSTGYRTLDIEPNTLASHNITIGLVRGAVFQCAPPTAAVAAYSIKIGQLDLDPSFAANSTPAYASYSVSNAVELRNTIDITLDHLRINGHTGVGLDYVWNAGEQRGQAIRIGYLKSTGVGATDVTYNCVIKASGCDSLTIDDGNVALQATTDCVVLGDSSGSTFTRVVIERLKVDGTVARYIKQGRFSNLLVSTVAAVVAFNRCTDCTVIDSDLTIPTLTSFSDRITFISTAAVCSTAYYGSSSTGMTRINSSFGGTNVPFATTLAAAAGVTGETVIGGTTATTVGAAGGASALPATPLGYVIGYVGGTAVKLPYYNT